MPRGEAIDEAVRAHSPDPVVPDFPVLARTNRVGRRCEVVKIVTVPADGSQEKTPVYSRDAHGILASATMSNPYQSPTHAAPQGRKEPGPLPPPQEPGLAGHIRAVAVLMLLQGFFEVAFGAILTVMAFVFPAGMAAMAADPQVQAEGGPDPQVAARMIMTIYLVMGLAGMIPGLVHLAAGFRNVQYRGRTFGIAALALGLGTMPIFICLPTAVILGVYGLVVYLQPSSVKAFEMGEQGYSAEAIYATFFAGKDARAS